MKLSEYIRQVTPAAFAKRFGISERAAASYMYGDRSPRPALARKIVKLTPVDWEGVYEQKSRKVP